MTLPAGRFLPVLLPALLAAGTAACHSRTCPGVSTSHQGMQQCRTFADCSDPTHMCILPWTAGGMQVAPEEPCDFEGPAAQPALPGRVCGPEGRYEPDCRRGPYGCGPGATCTEAGFCLPKQCGPEEGRCGPNLSCRAFSSSKLEGRTRCVPRACVQDRDCDCGICGQGRCWDRPGFCAHAIPRTSAQPVPSLPPPEPEERAPAVDAGPPPPL